MLTVTVQTGVCMMYIEDIMYVCEECLIYLFEGIKIPFWMKG